MFHNRLNTINYSEQVKEYEESHPTFLPYSTNMYYGECPVGRHQLLQKTKNQRILKRTV